MQIKLLKRVVEDITSKQATEIVDLLAGKKDVNEFLIAKKLKLTINQTRNILYKLSDAGLVSFTRKKDKRKGWYIYFWTLSSLKSLEFLEKRLLGEFEQLENQLKSRKTKRFYICKICNLEIGEETALLNNFVCQECGQVYDLAEKDKVIRELGNKITKIKRHLGMIREEKEKEAEKQEKRKARERKKEDKKKIRKKAKRKGKKNGKKKTKKKIKKKISKKIKKKKKSSKKAKKKKKTRK